MVTARPTTRLPTQPALADVRKMEIHSDRREELAPAFAQRTGVAVGRAVGPCLNEPSPHPRVLLPLNHILIQPHRLPFS
jgi:hypothetical protein